MPDSRALARGAALALASMMLEGLPVAARAQISVTASLDSEYRYRGVSVSDGHPALTLALAYDHNSGIYLGGSAVATATSQAGVQLLGHIEYVGYAWRNGAGPSWDVGVNNEDLSLPSDPRYALRYTEVYVGVIGRNLSAHLHYSPNYLRPGEGALYADVDGAVRLADVWRLFGRVGVLTPLNGAADRRERYDLRAGIAREFKRCELRLAWTAVFPQRPPQIAANRPAVVVGASYFF
jgi:uncharacterized protein (TIGR02001 family)